MGNFRPKARPRLSCARASLDEASGGIFDDNQGLLVKMVEEMSEGRVTGYPSRARSRFQIRVEEIEQRPGFAVPAGCSGPVEIS